LVSLTVVACNDDAVQVELNSSDGSLTSGTANFQNMLL
jgi:hypothetical protein